MIINGNFNFINTSVINEILKYSLELLIGKLQIIFKLSSKKAFAKYANFFHSYFKDFHFPENPLNYSL